MCIYQFLREFQTLIVGTLGFAGVALTMFANAWLARQQHTLIIEHERSTLRTALAAELELIQESFRARGFPTGNNGEPVSAFFPERTNHPVYDNQIGKIGLLTVSEVSAIIHAYTLVDEAPVRLRLLSGDHHPSYEKPGYIYIQAQHEETASGIYKSFLPAIEKALNSLVEPK